MLFPVFTLLIGSTILSSCFYDNEEYLYPGQQSNCDTLSPTYTANIAKIIANNNCNGCHSSASHPNTDVVTDNYGDLKTNIERVWQSINYFSAIHMPKEGPKLSECELATIGQWRNLEMPEN